MIQLNESNKLEFSMSIKNATGNLDKACLYIECAGYDIVLPIIVEEDKAIVNVPVLENIVEPGKRNIRMEVVLGGVLYTPFKDVLEFAAPPSFKVETSQQVEERHQMPTISIKSPIIEKIEAKTEAKQPVDDSNKSSKYATEFAKLLEGTFQKK